MSPAEVIEHALKRGSQTGLGGLSPVERKVWLISQAEALCDMEGIDAFLAWCPGSLLSEAAEAFRDVGALDISQSLNAIRAALPDQPEDLLDRAESLITARSGYDYAAILRFVSQTA